MNLLQTDVLIKQCTIEEVLATIQGFSERYRRYQTGKYNSVWAFRLLSMKGTKCVAQLTDIHFEPPRGKVPSDAPYIFIEVVQIETNVAVLYKVRWQMWKVILIMFTVILLTVLSLVHIYYSFLDSQHPLGAVALWICIGIAFVFWLKNNISHDKLTSMIFAELLQKNFTEIQMDKKSNFLNK